MAEKNDFAVKINHDEQLSFFQIEERYLSYSNILSLFNCIPLYFTRQPGNNVEIARREFKYIEPSSRVETKYKLKITRGIYDYQVKSGKNQGKETIIKRFPNAFDEQILTVIIKLATEGQSIIDGGYVSVQFSLYQIYEELKRFGKTHSYNEIQESLEILSSAMYDLSWIDRDGNTRSCKSQILFDRRRVVAKEADMPYKAKGQLYRFTLHPTVTKDIVEKSFRLFNYDKHMRLSSSISRWLHIRLSNYFTWANYSLNKPYRIALSTIHSLSCFPASKSKYKNKDKVIDALTELSKGGIIDLDRLEVVPVRYGGANGSKKINDYIFHIFPAQAFEKDQKFSNYQSKEINKQNGFSVLSRLLNSNNDDT